MSQLEQEYLTDELLFENANLLNDSNALKVFKISKNRHEQIQEKVEVKVISVLDQKTLRKDPYREILEAEKKEREGRTFLQRIMSEI